jgi:tRNA(Ile)-lysidine synthetase-like protein
MDISIKPGKYVVAVSGGVDSMVLLHMLQQQPDVQSVVAHFDHGIRADSSMDAEIVQQAAAGYGLPFVTAAGQLGAGASEAAAREARYAFLRQALAAHQARAIITAHHQDDVLETAIINMLRGTGRRGLSSLRSTDGIVRPLLHIPKQALVDYARQHRLQWREDSTNRDDRYLRNYIRLHIMPRMSAAERRELIAAVQNAARLNGHIDAALAGYTAGDSLNRRWFSMLPHDVSTEVIAAWLRRRGAWFDRAAVERLTTFAKTAQSGKVADIDKRWRLLAEKERLTLLVK